MDSYTVNCTFITYTGKKFWYISGELDSDHLHFKGAEESVSNFCLGSSENIINFIENLTET